MRRTVHHPRLGVIATGDVLHADPSDDVRFRGDLGVTSLLVTGATVGPDGGDLTILGQAQVDYAGRTALADAQLRGDLAGWLTEWTTIYAVGSWDHADGQPVGAVPSDDALEALVAWLGLVDVGFEVFWHVFRDDGRAEAMFRVRGRLTAAQRDALTDETSELDVCDGSTVDVEVG